MDSDLTTAVRELTDALKERDKSMAEFQLKLLEELHELNTSLRHLQSKFASREF